MIKVFIPNPMEIPSIIGHIAAYYSPARKTTAGILRFTRGAKYWLVYCNKTIALCPAFSNNSAC